MFAATVASFVIDSYKTLSPDPSADTNALLVQLIKTINASAVPVVAVEPFKPAGRNIAANILFFYALILSLAGAMLATLIQIWMGNTASIRGPYETGPIEEFGQRKLRSLVAIQRYGLDALTNLVSALLHTSMTIFLIGLALYLSGINTTLTVAIAVLSVIATLIYAVISVLPLFDSDCPFSTPLTYILGPAVYALVAGLAVVVIYAICFFYAVQRWIRNKQIDLHDIEIWEVVKTLMAQPSQTQGFLRQMAGALIRGKGAEERKRLHDEHFESARPPGQMPLSAEALASILRLNYNTLINDPIIFRYMWRCLLDMSHPGVSETISLFRSQEATIRSISSIFVEVNTIPSALGALRFLQMLILSENLMERQAVALSKGDERWINMGPLLDSTLPAFITQLGVLYAEALRKEDVRLPAAIASLRWALIQAWGEFGIGALTPDEPGYLAKSHIASLLSMLHEAENLQLCSLTSSDSDDLRVLLADPLGDPRTELASRNALTLLRASRACDWHDGFQRPDATYVPEGFASLWDWPRLFSPSHLRPRPAATGCFRDLLMVENVDPAQPMSTAQATTRLHPVALRAILDLATIVDLTEPIIELENEWLATPPRVCHRGVPLIAPPPPNFV